MLASSGARLSPSAAPPQTFGQSVARDALLKLLTEHCTGEYGFTTTNEGFALSKTNRCGPVPAGAMVTAIGGRDVLRDGASTWDALHERCGEDSPVVLTIMDAGTLRSAEVPCSTAVPAGVPYLVIERLPED